jgi:hypothetical protein
MCPNEEILLPLAELVKIILLPLAYFSCLFFRGVATSPAMSDELTITQATERLQARGIKASRRTVASWVEQGLFKSKRWVEAPTGGFWVVSAREVATFEKPTVGRPSTKKASKKGGKNA